MRGAHARAARALLGWSQKVLAEKGRVGLRLLVDFERESRALTPAGMVALEKAITDAGLELIDEPGWVGVKIRRSVLDAAAAQDG